MKLVNMPYEIGEYFKNGPREIIKVTPNNDYTLTVCFDNDEIKVYDMSNHLFGVFNKLKDIKKFGEVFIDENGNIAWDIDKDIDSKIIWNNRIDICKDSVYLESI